MMLSSDEDCNDVMYCKQLYPSCVQYIQKEVEEECDKLEYEGSCMFDAYPDRIYLTHIVGTIYERIQDVDFKNPSLQAQNLQEQLPLFSRCYGGNCPPPPPPPPRPPRPPRPEPCPYGKCPPSYPDYHPDGSPNWLKNMTEVLLYNEMNDRRRRYRNRKNNRYH